MTAAGTRGDRTRRAIVAAARERFAARGFEDTTLGDVAADAGVSGPTVAFHFGSKAGLLTAVITEFYDGLIDRVEDAIDAPTSPAARLDAFARTWLRELDGSFALFGVFAAHGGLRATDSESGVALRDNNRRITRLFERLVDDLKAEGTLRDDVSTRLLRDAFFGTAEHVLRAQVHTSRRLDHDRLADEILDLLLGGAGRTTRAAQDDTRLAAIDRKLDRLLAQSGAEPSPDPGES